MTVYWNNASGLKSGSTMPAPLKFKRFFTASANTIDLGSFPAITPYVDQSMMVPDIRSTTFVYGVEVAYNHTKGIDITEQMHTLQVSGVIYFNPGFVETGDIIEVVYYGDYNTFEDGDVVTTDQVEQMMRHATSMYHPFLGLEEPNMDYCMDKYEGNTAFAYSKWTYHPRLFFNHAGWGYGSSAINANEENIINFGRKTLISWSPGSTKNSGIFIGDPAMFMVKESNEPYIVSPIPMIITNLTFFCKVKKDDWAPDDSFAIALDVSIDGAPSCLHTTNELYGSNDENLINSYFGEEKYLYMSFSDSASYNGLVPELEYGFGMVIGDAGADPVEAEGTKFFISRKRFGPVAANQLSIAGWLVSNENSNSTTEPTTELREWYLTVGGYIPRYY